MVSIPCGDSHLDVFLPAVSVEQWNVGKQRVATPNQVQTYIPLKELFFVLRDEIPD
jgi:hypothetical protein